MYPTGTCIIPCGVITMECANWAPAIMPGGGLACDMRGVGTPWGREMGVACAIFGVALGILGVPPAWLCWLPRADMLGAIGAAIGWL